ncbi:MAG: hypothetical protein CVT77_10790 [Alphaproteobacteria bacterium HGW-Alphaproteobacteria-16]|nr:MAG: hypothetical protein CVT77_10790 [Alphaproteobacteria bacterium HGW-Alphaproteobacteria-16]
MAMLGLVVACVMAGQMSAVFGVQAVRWVKAAQEHGIADRLIPQENRPVDPIDRIASLEIRDLSYRYPAGPNIVFEQVSLRLDAGEVLALSSPSGTGKTTLLRVITGLAEAQTGQLLVNGQAVSPLVYRHRIAAVFQDQDIGAGTIRAAVAGNLSLDPDSVWQAVGRVGVERLIRDLPMQLQTLIVEGPFPPSLLQPLLIARALVQNADLLILDEALAALSYERAKLLLDELRGEGKLVIFASHDPNIVALADRVLTIGAR